MHTPIVNRVKTRLAAGQPAVGASLYLSRTAQAAAVLARCGYDWLFLDLEHSAMDLDTAAQIALAAHGAGLAPIARVPAGEYGLASRLLDAGALGIVMPHVDSAADARAMAHRLRYPPTGGRSCGYGWPLTGFQPMPAAESMRMQDDAVLLVAMLETRAAIEQAEAIAAVPGIDVLMVGTLDLSIDLGIAGRFDHPQIDAAYARVAQACRQHGKAAGMAGITAAPQLRRYVADGVRFILAGSDLTMLASGAAQRLQAVEDALKDNDISGDNHVA